MDKNSQIEQILKEIGLTELPKPLKSNRGRKIWCVAVASVMKRDMTSAWCLCQNVTGSDTPLILKMYGTNAPVFKINELYPVLWMPEDCINTATTRESLIEYISQYPKDMPVSAKKELEQMSDEELRCFALNIDIHTFVQTHKFSNNKRYWYGTEHPLSKRGR